MARSGAPSRPLWLIANHENGWMGVFTFGSDYKKTLPVVDSEMIFDLAGLGREDFLRDFVGAVSAPNHEWRAG
jgi:hypothetical protein